MSYFCNLRVLCNLCVLYSFRVLHDLRIVPGLESFCDERAEGAPHTPHSLRTSRASRSFWPGVSARVVLASLCFGLCLVPFCAPGVACGADILTLLREKTAGMTSVQSSFTQETTIPMFKEPLRSQGRFAFARPNALLWEYLSPVQEGFVLRENGGFRWQDSRAKRTAFTPRSDPVAGIIARQLIAWITFDIKSIEREYRIESLPGADLRLSMTPLKKDMGEVIESITITFTPAGPASRVELKEARGGTTVISFTDTVVNAPLQDGVFE